MSTNLNFVDNFDSIDEAQFSKLIRENDAPFIQYSFLKALENSGCVGRDLGWTPKHLVKSNENVLSGFMPMYIKNNSHGEFVFDHSWSYALNRAGRNYYPKLLTAIPFTPCETRKIITESDANEYVERIIDFMEEKSSIQSSEVLESEDTISFQTEIPKQIQQAMKVYIEKHPNWDQYRLLQAALAGFLIQNGISSRLITRLYIGNMFGSVSYTHLTLPTKRIV